MKHVTTQDRVVVQPEQKDNRTASGLIIPDLEEAITTTGVVIAVGPGRKTKKNVIVKVAVSVGDRIMFTTGTGISIKTDGKDYIILKEDEIIGVVEDE